MGVDLCRQSEPACRQGSQRVLRRGRGAVEGSWEEPGATIDQLAIGERLKDFSELAGRIHNEGLQRDDRGTFGFDGRSRATLICRTISAAPSADFGTAVATPASTERAAVSASSVSFLPWLRRFRRSQ